jgi:regulator of sigma E protease
MSEFFGSIWWLLVALGLLITFHEFGHFWVARRCGVRVLKFSIGFGRPIWSRTGADGVEYVISILPLGGFVKMLDEREGDVPDSQLHEAFNRKPVWQRIAIVVAGPAFNLIFTILAFWIMFMVGIPESRPILGEVTGIAAAPNRKQTEGRLCERHAPGPAVLELKIRERWEPSITAHGGSESTHELDLRQLKTASAKRIPSRRSG